jgi:Conjugal transfer protein TraD
MGAVPQTLQLQVKINRLQAQKAALENKLQTSSVAARKARTRTLIQLGGLMNLVALPNLCGINDGDNLQLDLEASDKAAVLLGMLVHLQDSLPPTLSDQLIASFKQKGIRMMKNQSAQSVKHAK